MVLYNAQRSLSNHAACAKTACCVNRSHKLEVVRADGVHQVHAKPGSSRLRMDLWVAVHALKQVQQGSAVLNRLDPAPKMQGKGGPRGGGGGGPDLGLELLVITFGSSSTQNQQGS